MPKLEISWKSQFEDGEKREVSVTKRGDEWLFWERIKRFDNWEACPKPSLEDWLNLLEAVQRRIARQLLRPEEDHRLKKKIREQHPDVEF